MLCFDNMALQSDSSSSLVSEILEVSSRVCSECSDNESSSSNDIEDIREELEQPVVSLLSKLKPPPASEFGRKRKIKSSPPPIGKRRSRGSSVLSAKENSTTY